ncbi:MAG: hypothetical protein E6I88_09940 [Chloroflexi bacterium]|nr:MAG: hypothetical protein E6I88_09940 [Chloroflexota bacterium]
MYGNAVSPRTIGVIPLLALLVLSSCGSGPTPRASAAPTATIRPSASPITTAKTTALPIGRWAAAAAYDETRHNLVLFGGLAGQTLLDDTWTWNGSTWTQRQGLTISPPARHGAAIAYDEVNRQVILFGGLGSKVAPSLSMAGSIRARARRPRSTRRGHGMAGIGRN